MNIFYFRKPYKRVVYDYEVIYYFYSVQTWLTCIPYADFNDESFCVILCHSGLSCHASLIFELFYMQALQML